jgi:hypothetical protein
MSWVGVEINSCVHTDAYTTPRRDFSPSICNGYSAVKEHPIVLRWGEMAPLPKKSPDLGNSFPGPRALMYNKS